MLLYSMFSFNAMYHKEILRYEFVKVFEGHDFYRKHLLTKVFDT